MVIRSPVIYTGPMIYQLGPQKEKKRQYPTKEEEESHTQDRKDTVWETNEFLLKCFKSSTIRTAQEAQRGDAHTLWLHPALPL